MDSLLETNLDRDLELRNMTELSEGQIALLSQLKVSEWQEIKGGSFSESVEAWLEGPSSHVLGICFLLQDQPIGMTLFKRPPVSPSWVSNNAASIHGLKIMQTLQGKGLGHQGFSLSVQHLKEKWPETTALMLAVDSDNVAALAVYRAFGMEDSGPVFDGLNGPENRFTISL